MNSKILRKIFAFACVFILLFSVSANVLARLANTATGTRQAFGIAERHTSTYLNGGRYANSQGDINLQYSVDGRIAYRIYAGNSASSGDFNTAIVCLDKTGRFPQEPSSSNDGQYTSKGPVSSSTITSNAEKIQWLVNNAMIPEDSAEMKDQKIAEIFESIIESTKTDVNPVRVEDIKKTLTIDDIMIALQLAVWNVTNGYTANVIRANDGTTEDAITDSNNIFGKNKGVYIKYMAQYYIDGMNTNKQGITNGTNPQFLNPDQATSIQSNGDIFLGPYTINDATNDYTVDISFYNGENQKLEGIDYDILNGNTTNSLILAPTKNSLNNKTFYIRVDLSTLARKVKITLTPKIQTATSVGTVWSTGKEGDQELLSIERTPLPVTPVTIETPFTPVPPEHVYDLALRKYISAVIKYNPATDSWVRYELTGTDSRAPQPQHTPSSTYNEYSYEHKKEPLEVEVGNIVVYNIEVFNECDEDMLVTSITDYLPPSGLSFSIPANEEDPRYEYNSGWTYNNASNSVSTTKDAGYILKRRENTEIIGVRTVQIALDVTEDAKGKIVTNIAEITGFTDTTNKIVTDKDSGYFENQASRKKVDLPKNEQEWQDYNGNNNKTELNDNSYYYKGQEDDDDFEKIKVKGNIDLALRKNITHLNGKEVTPKRIGTIDTSPLATPTNGNTAGSSALGEIDEENEESKNNTKINSATTIQTNGSFSNSSLEEKIGGTANYNDIKTPAVKVKVGDLVRYKIRLINEGQVEAYAAKVTDFIPEGLAFIPFYNDNVNNGWTVVPGTGTAKTLREIDIYNRVTNSDLYSGTRETAQVYTGKVTVVSTKKENTLLKPYNKSTDKLDDSEFLELVCLVVEPSNLEDEKVLRNIAVIDTYKDSSKTVQKNDIDSETENITKEEDFNISNHEDDEDYDDVIITKEVNFYDLALKKFISKVTSADGTVKTIPEDQKRIPDNSNDLWEVENVDALVNRSSENPKADAVYRLKKEPKVYIENGDIVTYKIRIYNEGTQDAVLKEVVDSVPKGLRFVTYEKNDDGTYKSGSKVNYDNEWVVFNENANGNSGWSSGIKTQITNDESFLIKAFDKTKVNTNSKGLSYIELEVELKVDLLELTEEEKAQVMASGIINKAEITNDDGEDNDSTPNNKIDSEDDIDYDVIVPNVYDLALKKAVIEVTGENGVKKTIPEDQKRTIVVENTDNLKNRSANGRANATYSINKSKPVSIVDGDYVTYVIRVYNEGRQDAKNITIREKIPTGLEFVPYEVNTDGTYKSGSRINYQYKWNDRNYYEPPEPDLISLYLDKKTIPAFDNTQSNGEKKEKGLSYEEIKVEFKVNLSKLTDEQKSQIMKNGIENIVEILMDDGSDNDSDPGNDNPQEDDQDNDIIIPKEFDLALRKFIVGINEKEIASRVPEVSYEDGEIRYNHPKDSVVVYKDQEIRYAIRVYNEGTQDGYAAEITDDIPNGLEFVKDHSLNQKYQWKMYDKDGKETNDTSKAVKIKTTYLSKENESKPGDNLIKAFDSNEDISDSNPDHQEIYVVFNVIKEPTEKPKIMTNTAEISNDTDENGNDVEDTDSVPGDGEENEDDIDTESVEMKYFDLALLKYVSKVYVTESGVTKEIETGYNGLENPEPVVKIELDRKKLSTTDIKYLYTIKVTNEGEIEGYAKEITDRIPDGLAFNESDNTEWGWKVTEDGRVTTDYLANKLLKPGQSAEVPIVLRWINNSSNLGQKVNVAEISKDENEYGIPDIDSKPNNNIEGEDDQDNAIVVLSINTGSAPIYITLIITIMAILGTGSYLIWKYVLKHE